MPPRSRGNLSPLVPVDAVEDVDLVVLQLVAQLFLAVAARHLPVNQVGFEDGPSLLECQTRHRWSRPRPPSEPWPPCRPSPCRGLRRPCRSAPGGCASRRSCSLG